MKTASRSLLTIFALVWFAMLNQAQSPANPSKTKPPPPKTPPPITEPPGRLNPYLYWLIHHQPPPYPYPVPPYMPMLPGPGYTVVNNYYTPYSGSSSGATQATAKPQTTALLPPGPTNQGIVAINLPTTAAVVWVDGQKLESGLSGTRVYTTPELEAGHTYYYTVKAQWVQRGENTSQQRKVTVEAGRTSVVDFTKSEDEK